MRFHIDHTVTKPGFSISHRDKLLLIGSCFSENVGKHLADHKFKVLSNPSGILFNPLSIYDCLYNAVMNSALDEKYLIERDSISLSFLHHSSVNSNSKLELVQKINEQTNQTHEFLKTCDHLVITFGSAFYYYHRDLKTVVANCHKQPSGSFEKNILSPENIVKIYSDLLTVFKKINPALKVIFTVSPVKYLKDGLVENNLSKATLILAAHELTKKFANCFYFPAYELVSDDLRDHRFYKEDLAHPNQQAIDYVWEKFSDCFFEEPTLELNKQIAKLNLALNHRQMQPDSSENAKLQEFIAKQKAQIVALYPEIEF